MRRAPSCFLMSLLVGLTSLLSAGCFQVFEGICLKAIAGEGDYTEKQKIACECSLGFRHPSDPACADPMPDQPLDPPEPPLPDLSVPPDLAITPDLTVICDQIAAEECTGVTRDVKEKTWDAQSCTCISCEVIARVLCTAGGGVWNPLTCSCKCADSPDTINACNNASRRAWDPNTCECGCAPEVEQSCLGTGDRWELDGACRCGCAPDIIADCVEKEAAGGWIFNTSICLCLCDPDAEAACNAKSGFVWNTTTCICECDPTGEHICLGGTIWDQLSCSCLAPLCDQQDKINCDNLGMTWRWIPEDCVCLPVLPVRDQESG